MLIFFLLDRLGNSQYDHSASTTAVGPIGDFAISYMDKSKASGKVFEDVVNLGGVKVRNVPFTSVDELYKMGEIQA